MTDQELYDLYRAAHKHHIERARPGGLTLRAWNKIKPWQRRVFRDLNRALDAAS